MIVMLLSLIGLGSGYLITGLSFDECKGKEGIIGLLIIPFLVLLLFNFSLLINTLFLFIIAHLSGSLIHLRRAV